MERVLYHSVKQTCKNVEFVIGTVISINPDSIDRSKIASATYKLTDGNTIHGESAILFVGALLQSSLLTDGQANRSCLTQTVLAQCTMA